MPKRDTVARLCAKGAKFLSRQIHDEQLRRAKAKGVFGAQIAVAMFGPPDSDVIAAEMQRTLGPAELKLLAAVADYAERSHPQHSLSGRDSQLLRDALQAKKRLAVLGREPGGLATARAMKSAQRKRYTGLSEPALKKRLERAESRIRRLMDWDKQRLS